MQYLETLDEMESIGNTAAQQTALSGAPTADEPAITNSSGTMQYVEAGKPTSAVSSSQAQGSAAPSSPSSSAAKLQPLGYRSAAPTILAKTILVFLIASFLNPKI